MFQETKGGFQEVYELLGAIPGSPPQHLLEACDLMTEGAASDDNEEAASDGNEAESGKDDSANEDDEEQEQAKVGAFEEPNSQQAQEESEQVDLFSISNTTTRK